MPDQDARPGINAVVDRIMMAYGLLLDRSAASSAEARGKVTSYVTGLAQAGETDPQRLAVCGLKYLGERDGRTGSP